MSKKSVIAWAWVVGAKGQFNESYPTSTVALHIAKPQFRDRKICRNHSFAIHFWHVLGDQRLVNRWEEYLKVSEWVSCYPSVNNLLRHLKFRKIGSESSRCIYGNAVYAFSKHTGKLPDELVALKKVDIEKLIEDFCYHKMDHGWKSPRTANTALFMLKTFFKVNGFRGSEKLEVECFHQSARDRTRPEYIPTLDEARRMANVAGSLRNRAIVFSWCPRG